MFSTRSFASSSASASASCSSSTGLCSDTDGLQHLASIDGLETLAGLAEGDLALRRVAFRDGEIRGNAELVGDGRDPPEQLLEPLSRREHLTPFQVDEALREPMTNRPPEVLLDQVV